MMEKLEKINHHQVQFYFIMMFIIKIIKIKSPSPILNALILGNILIILYGCKNQIDEIYMNIEKKS